MDEYASPLQCFNSRTPGGVRQTLTTCVVARLMFQFTHPGRGATQRTMFQRGLLTGFNSRTPGGVRPETFTFRYAVCGVSIHAPREGCDEAMAEGLHSSIKFQFTHPGRGATPYLTHIL